MFFLQFSLHWQPSATTRGAKTFLLTLGPIMNMRLFNHWVLVLWPKTNTVNDSCNVLLFVFLCLSARKTLTVRLALCISQSVVLWQLTTVGCARVLRRKPCMNLFCRHDYLLRHCDFARCVCVCVVLITAQFCCFVEMCVELWLLLLLLPYHLTWWCKVFMMFGICTMHVGVFIVLFF